MQQVMIDLQERGYPVYIGQGILNNIGEVCTAHGLPHRLAVITDRNVAEFYLHGLTNVLRHGGFEVRQMVIPPGER